MAGGRHRILGELGPSNREVDGDCLLPSVLDSSYCASYAHWTGIQEVEARDVRKRTIWLVLISGCVVAYIPFAFWRLWFIGLPFDPVAWREDARPQAGIRLGMADRLIARGSLLGKTRSEVIEQLGEPSQDGYFRDWDLVYLLGPERGWMSIDSEWLVLRLGPDEKVAKNELCRD